MNLCLDHARVWLGGHHFAEAVLFDRQRILHVGSRSEVRALLGPSDEVVDCGGRLVLPGFNDTHLHLYNKGFALQNVELRDCRSISEVVERCRRELELRPEYHFQILRGRGWNDELLEEKRCLTRRDLDQICRHIPVILTRVCGHIACVNSCALQRLGMSESAPVMEGGQIDCDENGRPTGIFRENALDLLQQLDPPLSAQDIRKRLTLAMEEAAKAGLTSVHSNDVQPGMTEMMMESWFQLRQQEAMPVRVTMQCTLPQPELLQSFLDRGWVSGYGDEVLRIGPLKLLVDGSLGARTAWLRQPYADDPSQRGIATFTQDQLQTLLTMAQKAGMQIVCHAIGDAAIESVLNGYRKINGDQGNVRRHGIVHCQITDEALLRRFQKEQIAALVQPIFLHADQHIAQRRVGKALAAHSYAFKTMADSGVPVSFGTDCPVEELNPFENLYCALTGKDLDHPQAQPWHPQECFELCQALECYSAAGAWLSFEEQIKGRIRPGMLPDFTICDQDLFAIPASQVRHVRSWMTISQGKVTWRTEH